MAVAIGRTMTRWIFDHFLWDTGGGARRGFWAGLWATRKILIALGATALLTWREWVEHHPPEIAIVAIIHFVLVSAVMALFVYSGKRLARSAKKAAKLPGRE